MDKYYYKAPFGILEIIATNDAIVKIMHNKNHQDQSGAITNPILQQAITQLNYYFSGKSCKFKVRINPQGTNYQKNIWDNLLKIPAGKTKSYKHLAQMAGNINGSRAAGGACNKNPISIIIPCHRIVGIKGITGYAGGLDRKKWLLDHEKKYFGGAFE